MRIDSIDDLKEICEDQDVEFFINLKGGLRSSKTICYNSHEKTFEIYNHIDDTSELLNERRLIEETNIGDAIEKGAFFKS